MIIPYGGYKKPTQFIKNDVRGRLLDQKYALQLTYQ